jgi:hypothetical protein
MADVHGSPGAAPQMPQAATPGPAPVPYGGPDLSPEPPVYSVPDVSFGMHAGAGVMIGVSGNAVQESSYAHDMNAGLAVPAVMGSPSPIYVGGDDDAGGRDDVSGTVAGAVANAEARFTEHYHDTLAQGSVLGDVMTLPASPLDPGVGSTGVTEPAGGFYDPPRNY